MGLNWGRVPCIAVTCDGIADLAESDKGVVGEKPEQAPAMIGGG